MTYAGSDMTLAGMPSAARSSVVTERIDSTPRSKLFQNCSAFSAPGRRHARPTMAIASWATLGLAMTHSRLDRTVHLAVDQQPCEGGHVRAAEDIHQVDVPP